MRFLVCIAEPPASVDDRFEVGWLRRATGGRMSRTGTVHRSSCAGASMPRRP